MVGWGGIVRGTQPWEMSLSVSFLVLPPYLHAGNVTLSCVKSVTIWLHQSFPVLIRHTKIS